LCLLSIFYWDQCNAKVNLIQNNNAFFFPNDVNTRLLRNNTEELLFSLLLPGSIRERCQAGLRCCVLPREELVWQTRLEVIIGDRSTIYGLNLLRIMFLLSIWTLLEITCRERHANITWCLSARNWHSDRYGTASRPAYWTVLLTFTQITLFHIDFAKGLYYFYASTIDFSILFPFTF